jgi:predicted small metal-binding protein
VAMFIKCECGFVGRGDGEDDVLARIRAHMREDHPSLLDTVTRDDLLGWIERE